MLRCLRTALHSAANRITVARKTQSTMAHSSAAPIFIPGEKVRELVTMRDIVKEVRRALQWFSSGAAEGGVVQPVRTAVPVQQYGGFLLLMPAFSQRSNGLGVKLLTLYPGNTARGIPSHQGIVLVFDPSTGVLQALVDGAMLTDMRTAAASAVAVKALVPKPPSILCIVGTGEQARSHPEALQVEQAYSEVRIWGRNPANAQKCATAVGGSNVVVCESLPEALRDADVIVTVTTATEPVVFGKWLKPGAVVCCVGGCRPEWRELDDELMQNSVVVVDTREGAEKESGDIILSKVEIFAEIGEVLSGKKTLPRVPDCGKKFTVFKSMGMAIEDVVSAKLVYDRFMSQQK